MSKLTEMSDNTQLSIVPEEHADESKSDSDSKEHFEMNKFQTIQPTNQNKPLRSKTKS